MILNALLTAGTIQMKYAVLDCVLSVGRDGVVDMSWAVEVEVIVVDGGGCRVQSKKNSIFIYLK